LLSPFQNCHATTPPDYATGLDASSEKIFAVFLQPTTWNAFVSQFGQDNARAFSVLVTRPKLR
jgi:hypothetical protein